MGWGVWGGGGGGGGEGGGGWGGGDFMCKKETHPCL